MGIMDHIPHFGMEWSGSRVTWLAKNLPFVGDVDLSSAGISPFRDGGQIPNFRNGGQIPDDRAARPQVSLARLHRQHGTSGERATSAQRAGGALPTNRAQATEANMAARRRQGGASAPTRRRPNPPRAPRHSGGQHTGIGADMAALTPASAGLSGGGPVGLHAVTGARRQKHEFCPGVA